MEPLPDGVLVTRQSPKEEQAWLGVFWGDCLIFIPWRGENKKKFWSLKKTKRKVKRLIRPYDFNNV